jgi:hypothetical protein
MSSSPVNYISYIRVPHTKRKSKSDAKKVKTSSQGLNRATLFLGEPAYYWWHPINHSKRAQESAARVSSLFEARAGFLPLKYLCEQADSQSAVCLLLQKTCPTQPRK